MGQGPGCTAGSMKARLGSHETTIQTTIPSASNNTRCSQADVFVAAWRRFLLGPSSFPSTGDDVRAPSARIHMHQASRSFCFEKDELAA